MGVDDEIVLPRGRSSNHTGPTAEGKLIPPQGGSAAAPPRAATGSGLTEELWAVHQKLMDCRKMLHDTEIFLASLTRDVALLLAKARGV